MEFDGVSAGLLLLTSAPPGRRRGNKLIDYRGPVGLRRDRASDQHLGPNAKRRVGANGGLQSTSGPLS